MRPWQPSTDGELDGHPSDRRRHDSQGVSPRGFAMKARGRARAAAALDVQPSGARIHEHGRHAEPEHADERHAQPCGHRAQHQCTIARSEAGGRKIDRRRGCGRSSSAKVTRSAASTIAYLRRTLTALLLGRMCAIFTGRADARTAISADGPGAAGG